MISTLLNVSSCKQVLSTDFWVEALKTSVSMIALIGCTIISNIPAAPPPEPIQLEQLLERDLQIELELQSIRKIEEFLKGDQNPYAIADLVNTAKSHLSPHQLSILEQQQEELNLGALLIFAMLEDGHEAAIEIVNNLSIGQIGDQKLLLGSRMEDLKPKYQSLTLEQKTDLLNNLILTEANPKIESPQVLRLRMDMNDLFNNINYSNTGFCNLLTQNILDL
jgi:hypothetical protein